MRAEGTTLADHDQDQTAADEPGRPDDPRTSEPGAEDARRGDDGSAGVGSFGWPASDLAGPFGLQPPFGTRAPSPEPARAGRGGARAGAGGGAAARPSAPGPAGPRRGGGGGVTTGGITRTRR